MIRQFIVSMCLLLGLGCNSSPSPEVSDETKAEKKIALKSSDAGEKAETPSAPPAKPGFELKAAFWKEHLTDELMPFWMSPSAKGESETDPFPTFRCAEGAAFGESGCDIENGEYAELAKTNKTVRSETKTNGPFEWITGPKNEVLFRRYVRMHSRQTYAYGVAYHLTGDPKYLELAHRGVEWLVEHALEKINKGMTTSFTFVKDGKGEPNAKLRTSQDQSYTMMGLAFYYYLTRDPKILKVLTDLRDYVISAYQSPDWEDGRLLKWMLKNHMEPKPTCLSTIADSDKGTVEQKELVALLDQVNAYMLLITDAVPKSERQDWLKPLYSMAETIRDRFYNDGQKSTKQATTGISPVVPEGMFAGCLTYKGPPVPPQGTVFCKDGKNPPPLDPENCDPANHHTDFGHSIKSFWMLYLIGREKDDLAMQKFSIDGADELFKLAYLNDGSWGRAKLPAASFDPANPSFVIDRNKEWWIYAELDQMAGTMALRDPSTHVPRLNTTYHYWIQEFLTPTKEVVQWRYDSCPNENDKNCYNNKIPKVNLWKNGFHSTEHALVAYITTSGVEHTPAVLYYALVNKDTPKTELQPYYYRASSSVEEEGTIEHDGETYQKIRAEFTDIQ